MSSTRTKRLSIKQKLRSFRKAVSCVSRSTTPRKRSKEFDKKIQVSAEILNEDNDSMKQEEKQKIEKYKQENLLLREELEDKKALFEEDKKVLIKDMELLKIEINVKQVQIEKNEEEKILIKQEYEMKEFHIKEEFEKKFEEKRCELEQKILKLKQNLTIAQEEVAKHVFVNDDNEALDFVKDSSVLIQEVKSLRTVLDLKQKEIKDMRLALAGTKQKEEALQVAEERIRLLRARCEDLQEQLRRKAKNEQNLEKEILRLRKVVLDKNAEDKKLSYHNEEQLWKLQCDKKAAKEILQNSQSEQDPQTWLDNSTVKRVIRKRQSIGYTLDLDDEPDTNKKNKIQTGRIEKHNTRKNKP